jgi:hypothetical protein
MENMLDVLHATVAAFDPKRQTEVTLGRLNLFVYLVDWHLRINNKSGVSGATWVNGSFGPTSAEVEQALQRRALFKLEAHETESGRNSVFFQAVGSGGEISADAKKSINHVTKLYDERRSSGVGDPGAEFKRLVLSTYGVMHTEKGDEIDIQKQAMEYRKVRGFS